ncbi:MAG: PcfJ domain-containing protein [Oscillospiraceae bacterium]|nr:PcfJ domain-containing protein [Oscillospiraceae bacterium]
MRKQELRKHADPGLKFSPGHGLLHTEAIDYILRTAVRNIAGQRVLAVYLYDRQAAAQGDTAPCYTVFQTRRDYITAENMEGGALKWRSSCLDNLLGGWPRKQCAFYTQKDQERVIRFCELDEVSGLNALALLQARIMATHRRERIIARERKIIETMERVPAKPRDLKGWIHREVLPAYVIYTYRKGKKRLDGWCTSCRHDVKVEGARHNAEGHCPRCGRAVTFKPAGRVGKLYDRATAQVIQRTGGNELLLRIFKAGKSYRPYRGAKEDVWENARFFIRWDDSGEISIEPYYDSYKGITTRWRPGERPGMSPWVRTFEQDACGSLYLRGLGEVLAGTPWQYSQMQAFYAHDHEPLEVLPYLQRYVQRPFIEYLVKLGLYKLAQYAVYGSSRTHVDNTLNFRGRNPREILGVRLEDIPLLQSLDASPEQLTLLRALRGQGIRAEESLLRWYEAHGVSEEGDILRPLRYTTPFKLTRYIENQFERLREQKTEYGMPRYREPRNVLSEYRDYLGIGKALGYDLKNTFVLFPRDLRKAHDTATNLYRPKKDTYVEKAIGAAYPELTKQYGCSRGGFAVIAPQTAKEIVAEGHALRHCVGTYTERMARDEYAILFLRRTADLNAPFVTLRVKDGRLVENRGLQNGDPPADAQKFLKRWERDVLQSAPARMAA